VLSTPVAIALALCALSAVVSAATMAGAARSARAPASLLGLGGCLMALGLLLDGTGQPAAPTLLAAVGGVCWPLALAVYPRLAHGLVARLHPTATALAGLAVVASAQGWGGHDTQEALVLPAAAVVCGLVVLAWWRLEREPDDRTPLAWCWLAVALATVLLFCMVFGVGEQVGTETARVATAVGLGGFAIVGPALCAGVWRTQVVDVRALVVNVAVSVAAVLAFMGLYAMADGLLAAATGGRPSVGALALVAGVLALVVHPTRQVMRSAVDALLFGHRPDPLDAAERMASGIGDDPAEALEVIRSALVLPYVGLRVAGSVTAEAGQPVEHTTTVPVPGADDWELVVGIRPGDLGLTTSDVRTLRLAVPLLGQVLRSRSLAEDLQESRGAAIATIAEERRRLRRDLHDGLGPTLSGIAFTTDAARNSLADPEAADALLQSVRASATAAVAQIRELVYGLRPPALDELGLLGALQQHAHGLRSAGGRSLRVAIVADDLPPLPAATEVAAYRIVAEALTNVARHSPAESARVEVRRLDGLLDVRVRDAGGPADPWTAGVGQAAMHERAHEVGGTVEIQRLHEGVEVHARLPF
jgi:signal transduction histidine kinase